MKKLSHAQIIWIVALLILLAMIVYPLLSKHKSPIASFQECMDAGYPIMESYPRQCSDGEQTFVEEIAPMQEASDEEEAVFCTMDAKQCPDGSYVGRVGPNCEFAPCPGE